MLKELSTVEWITLGVSVTSLVVSIYVGIRSWWKIRKFKYNVNHANNLKDDIANIDKGISSCKEIHLLILKYIGKSGLRGVRFNEDNETFTNVLFELSAIKVSLAENTLNCIELIEEEVQKIQKLLIEDEIDFDKLKESCLNISENIRELQNFLMQEKRKNNNDYSGITL